MASQVLYTYGSTAFNPSSGIQIAAEYSGASITVKEIEIGTTNKTPEFLKKFPLGKVPALESDGNAICETDAITYFLANEQLKGSDALSQAHVQQYISIANNEVIPPVCTWAFPCLGFKQYNKTETESAKERLRTVLSVLNDILLDKTYLVGERVTLADIKLCCSLALGYKVVFDPKFREPYVNLNRWFLTCVNQPQFKKILGEIELCKAVAAFDSKKYNELHPKAAKKGKEKQPAAKKEEPKPKAEEKEEPAPAPRPKPGDCFNCLPAPKTAFDDWKKMYSNNPIDVSFPWFCENIDLTEDYSVWRAEYNYNDELNLPWMAENAVLGMLERLESGRKFIFGSAKILGTENKATHLKGLWMNRGQKPMCELNEDWNVDLCYYTLTKLDLSNEVDKKYFLEMAGKTESVDGHPVINDHYMK